ncbi:winged helix-turn-helix domain-containing protein [Sphaerotilus sulfidivorans]
MRRQGRRVELDLSPVELRLLRCLVEQPGRVLTREMLRSQVWGEGAAVDLRTVDQNIRRLRRELGEADAGELIRTVRGIGYRFSEGATA